MRTKLYTKSSKAWDAMIQAIDKANKSVFIEMYIFESDTSESHDFLGKLKRKAQEGVRVVIVADAFGSKALQKEAGELSKTGIELIFFSHWLRHIHRKIMIIDEKTAFIGGVNIGKRFAHWNDLQLRLHGKIAKRLLKSFAYTYKMAGGKDEAISEWRKRKLSYKLKFWLVEHIPAKNIHTLRNHYVEKITGAKKSIRMATPYFNPPRWLISLLDGVSSKGIEVEILIPRKVDWRIMNAINFFYMEQLYSSGIKFYLGKEMNHSKLLIIDDEEVLVGSQNLDQLSFGINNEAGVSFKETALVEEVLRTFQKWKTESQLFMPGKHKKTSLDHMATLLVRILRPIL